MKTVELHSAWTWDCDNCGRENFCRSISLDPAQFDDDELQEMAVSLGVIEHYQNIREELAKNPKITHLILSQPEQVECAHCKAEFAVGNESMPEDDR